MRSPPPARVLVTSDQGLVAEAIGAALRSRGYAVEMRQWPSEPDQTTSGAGDLEIGSGDVVGLLLSDLDRPPRSRQALAVLRSIPLPWLVLTAAPSGPVWGGLLEAGARLVASSTTTLDELESLLTELALGGGTPLAERRRLVAQWRRLTKEQADLADRIKTMTPRELEVLGFLYAGTPVRSIARRLSLSEATVRSLVQRVLRKLGVRSQLAAVAALCAAADPADHVIAEIMAAGGSRRARRSPKSGKDRDRPHGPAVASPEMGSSRRTGMPTGEQG